MSGITRRMSAEWSLRAGRALSFGTALPCREVIRPRWPAAQLMAVQLTFEREPLGFLPVEYTLCRTCNS